jgi:hypothetical protein
MILFYFNWAGTPEELKEFASRIKNPVDVIEGINLLGIFVPTSAWHYVMIWNSTKYEKALQTLKAYSEKYGQIKISLGKTELLHTIEEVPFL